MSINGNYSQGSSSRSKSCSSTQWLRQLAAIRRIRRTDVKYLIFIYSEQMTHSENENDHFDLDHLDHILAMRPAEKLMG